MTYRERSIYDIGFTDQEIRDYIKSEIPNISYKDMMKIREEYLIQFVSLHTAIDLYKDRQQIKEWNKSKDKHYYRVMTCRGYYKIVYMCKEMVEYFYGNKYTKI